MTKTAPSLLRQRFAVLAPILCAAILLTSLAAASAAEDIRWAKKQIGDMIVELPADWTKADDLQEGETAFQESAKPTAPRFAVFRDIDLTDLGAPSGQISTSSAIVGGEIGRRVDWRQGGERGATIILSDRGSEGGQVAINFSATRRDWNRIRPILSHAVRSIRFNAGSGATAKRAPKQNQPRKTSAAAAPKKAPAKDEKPFKKVDGPGFHLQIPSQWKWIRTETNIDNAYVAGDKARGMGVHIGLLKADEDGYFDGALDDFIEKTRSELAADELVESVDLTDDPRWIFQEIYQGKLPDGKPARLEITFNDEVEPAIAMALLGPADAAGADAEALDTMRGSMTLTELPAQTAEAPATAADEPAPEEPAREAPKGAPVPAPKPKVAAAPEIVMESEPDSEAPEDRQIEQTQDQPEDQPREAPSATFKKVEGEGFTMSIPDNWTWARTENAYETAYVAGDAGNNTGIRVGLLAPDQDGYHDSALDAFIEVARDELDDEELVESIDLEDDPNWQLRESYEGATPNGDPVTLTVLFSALVDPGIALAVITPVEEGDELRDKLIASMKITAARVEQPAEEGEIPPADEPAPKTSAAAETPNEAQGDDPAPAAKQPAAETETPPVKAEAPAEATPPAKEEAPAASARETETPATNEQPVTEAAKEPVAEEPSEQQNVETVAPKATSEEKAGSAEDASKVVAAPAPMSPTSEEDPVKPAETSEPADQERAADPTETPAEAKPEEPKETTRTAALNQPADTQTPATTQSPASAPAYMRALPDFGISLRVPDGWTVQTDGRDGTKTWRLRDKAWRDGEAPDGVFSATATASPADSDADVESAFKQSVEMLSSSALSNAETLAETPLKFAGSDAMQADIAGVLGENGSAPVDAVMRVIVSKRAGKLVVLTAFAPAANRQALDGAFAPDGVMAPMADESAN